MALSGRVYKISTGCVTSIASGCFKRLSTFCAHENISSSLNKSLQKATSISRSSFFEAFIQNQKCIALCSVSDRSFTTNNEKGCKNQQNKTPLLAPDQPSSRPMTYASHKLKKYYYPVCSNFTSLMKPLEPHLGFSQIRGKTMSFISQRDFHHLNLQRQNTSNDFSPKIRAIFSQKINDGLPYCLNFHILNCRLKHTKPKVPPSRMNRLYEIERAISDEEAAKQFVYALNSNERKCLHEELARFHGDDSGSTQNEKPTREQLKQVALHQAFPFLGFGFLDNLLMIVAGEYIDLALGTTLGISTMAAAAFGNLISDLGGLGSAHYVEGIASKLGFKHPHLSPSQVDMGITKWAANLGKVIGITIGCLLGMFPLLFFDDKESNEKKAEADEKKT